MADVAAMDIIIGANVQDAIKGFDHLSQELADLAKTGVTSIGQLDRAMKAIRAQIEKTTSTTELTKLNKALAALSAESNKLKNIGLGEGAKKATTDFTNFNRVIQDLPFGFIAIQNNLTQLVPGVGALGLAVSVATAALTFAQTGFSNWTRGAEEAKKANDDFNKSLNEGRASGLSTGIQLQAFVDIAKDSTLPLEQRNAALKEANDLMGTHGEKLTLANVGTAEMTKQVEDLTKALINQSLATKFADRIADLMIEQMENLKGVTQATKDFNKATERTKGQTDPTGLTTALNVASRAAGKLSDAEGKVKSTADTINELKASLKDASNESTALFGDMGEHSNKAAKGVKKVKDEFTSLVEIERQHRLLQESTRGATLAPLFGGFESSVDIGKKSKAAKQLFVDIKKGQDSIKKNLQDNLMLPDDVFADLDKRTEKRRKDQAEQLAAIMAGAKELQNVFAEIFTSIAENGKISIDSLLKSIEQLIIKLAAAAAAAALISVIFPGAGGFMKIFGNLAGLKGLIPGMASGGIITSERIIRAGEAGPEAIIPLDRLRSFMGNTGAAPVVLETRISGNDLFLIQQRTAARRTRTY